MGRVIMSYAVHLYPSATCIDCSFRAEGAACLQFVRAHVKNHVSHRVMTDTATRRTYEWSER